MQLLLARVLVELEAFARRVDEPLALKLGEVLDGVLVKRVGHEDHLDVLGEQLLHRGRAEERVAVLARDVVDVLLIVAHAANVVLERDLLLALGGRIAEELGEPRPVRRVLHEAHLDVLPERLPKLGVLALLRALLLVVVCRGVGAVLALANGLLRLGLVVLFLVAFALLRVGERLDHREHLARHLLADHLEDLVLLQHLAAHVERQRVRIDDAAHEGKVAREQLVKLVGDHDAPHVQLDVFDLFVVVLVQVVWRLLGDEEDRLELDLALGVEVGVGERRVVVLGQRLVEGLVLVLRDVRRRARPERLRVVHELPVVDCALHLLRLGQLGVGLIVAVAIILLLLLLLRLLLLLASLVRLALGLAVVDGHLLLLLLGRVQEDREVDELGVVLDEAAQPLLLEELEAVLLQMQRDLRAAAERRARRVLSHGERGVGRRLPDPLLLVVVRLGRDGHHVGDEVDGIETHTKLPDQVHVRALGEGLDEGRRARLRDGAEVLNEILARHPDAAVNDREGLRLFVGDNLHLKLGRLALAEHALLRQRHEADLVERVRGVGNELAKEDLLLGVERVDDDVHQLVHVRLEGKVLLLCGRGAASVIRLERNGGASERIGDGGHRLKADALRCRGGGPHEQHGRRNGQHE
mmetsp:Transcript_858/g.2667  ORF Transcript_858/g.2667 Transcript_858/m.2667 type:complete len:639 (-) Transcript_858:40-1956(-)